jgi:hypothetical protein
MEYRQLPESSLQFFYCNPCPTVTLSSAVNAVPTSPYTPALRASESAVETMAQALEERQQRKLNLITK